LVGRDVENGEIPVSEMDRVNQMIEDIRKGMNGSLSAYLRNGSKVQVLTTRSFVFPYHLSGRDVENGEIPVSEMDRVNQMIEDISYNNAKNFFKF